MKLYAVTKGTYSAYHIIALTSDKNVANKLAKKYSCRESLFTNEKARVEEYEDGVVLLDKDPYFVRVNNGNITEVVPPYTEETWFNEEEALYDESVGRDSGGGYYTYAVARNEEEACKIAKDRIMRYIAETV
jgi:hypothetical protein